MAYYTQYPSPIGYLTLTSDGCALTGLWMDTQVCPDSELIRQDDLALFGPVQEWLDGYFRGRPGPMDFPLCPGGTAFRQRVWEILLTIPYGMTRTYGDIAREISPRMSAQAVGGAVGANPISIIIPCHRCVGARGQLTGYAGGLDKKEWLLRHEEETK